MVRKLESWEHEPMWLKALTPFLRSRRFPPIPQNPERKKWYRFYPAGAISGDGEPAFAEVLLGTENKLVVFFSGGGVSIDRYTAARPASLYARDRVDAFYMVHLDLFADFVTRSGVLDDHPDNPFRNWSKVVLTYGTGDFHIGASDFPYTALDGSPRLLHHHGYSNYRAVMAFMKKWVPAPDDLLIAGCSGGAWGAALLADDVIGHYPECSKITCCVDSALGVKDDWARVATDVWGAPAEICERLTSDEMVSDSLVELWRTHGDRVRILYASSIRDAALTRMQSYFDGGRLEVTHSGGETFERNLRRVHARLAEEIPDVGWYLFDTPDGAQKKLGLTKHCVIADSGFHRVGSDGTSPREWMREAVVERVSSNYGLGLISASS